MPFTILIASRSESPNFESVRLFCLSYFRFGNSWFYSFDKCCWRIKATLAFSSSVIGGSFGSSTENSIACHLSLTLIHSLRLWHLQSRLCLITSIGLLSLFMLFLPIQIHDFADNSEVRLWCDWHIFVGLVQAVKVSLVFINDKLLDISIAVVVEYSDNTII